MNYINFGEIHGTISVTLTSAMCVSGTTVLRVEEKCLVSRILQY